MVTTWILILSLTLDRYNGNAASVQSVGPFATVEECQRAGNMWLGQMSTASRTESTLYNMHPHAVCVKTTAPQPTVTY